ncbi:Orn/Lys/Arg decarboxylase N-terminal domain-containing protein [Devosia sp.]|uniref:Orn/Lys/Arg decarboxylase N-terminal domain-containing protein n=1 Tax=Devosia sp. TaxID=1871048 RepID=UPI00345BD3FC
MIHQAASKPPARNAGGEKQPTRAEPTSRPVFLLLERGSSASVPIKVMRQVDEIVWLLEDTPLFVAGRIRAATERYIRAIVPPCWPI